MDYDNYAERIKPLFSYETYNNQNLTQKMLYAFLLKKEK